MKKKMKWEDIDPTSQERINHVQKVLNIKFPSDYLEFLQKYNGGYPDRDGFAIYFEGSKIDESSFAPVTINSDSETNEGILELNANPPVGLPSKLIIIGRDGGSGYICFDYRDNEEYPSIVYYTYAIDETGESIFYLAKTFEEFLDSLFI